MEEVKKVKLSTLICVVTILLIIIVAICLYFYFNSNKATISDSEVEGTNLLKGSTSLNIIPDSSENNLQLNAETDTQSSVITSQTDGKYDIQYVKDKIIINGKEHTYEVRYSSDMEFASEESDYYYSDGRLLFDGKTIRTITLKFNSNKKPIWQVKTAIINDVAIIYIDIQTRGCYFYAINDNAELVTTINVDYGTSISINDKEVTYYAINENSVNWYSVNNYNTQNDISVVKYQMEIGSDFANLNVIETYNSSEVKLAGKI